MKKILVTLIVSLAFCGSIFAQHPETHWPGFDYHAFQDQAALYASLMINGEPVDNCYENWDQMEVAAFVGEGDDMRMTGMFLTDQYVIEYGELFPTLNAEPIYYTTPGETVTFKMYNHATGAEYGECHAIIWDDGSEITILTGEQHWEGFDDPDHPLMLNFISSEPQTVLWEEEWTETPTISDDVEIGDDIVIIPAGYTAYANSVTFTGNGRIIIEDGGFFYHENEVEVSMQLDVTGYNSSDNAGYRLIATPVVSSNGTLHVEETNLSSGDFDLYRFNENPTLDENGIGKEWENFKTHWFDLFPKNGYLYANAENSTIVFAGSAMSTSNTEMVSLNYHADAGFAGWNLLGNPFTCKVYISDGIDPMPFYVLNEAGSEVEPTAQTDYIKPLEGFFVQATEPDVTCWFTTTPPYKTGAINMTVSQGRSTIDKAIISFGNGRNLGKFQLNPNHTKVYLPQDGKDYAVLHGETQGMMPVNFKAERNGSYSLNFSSEAVSFDYLHLIDNLTGNDIDLLANPSYCFDAKTTDHPFRFKLVYATGDNNTNDDFAYISNGQLIITGVETSHGTTLQIFDVLGHLVLSKELSTPHSSLLTPHLPTGVYMLQLTNGESVKTQKIVIE